MLSDNIKDMLTEYDQLQARRSALGTAWENVDWDDASAVAKCESEADDIKTDESSLLSDLVAELRS